MQKDELNKALNFGKNKELDLKVKVILGNSSQAQLKREAATWLKEAKKEAKLWDKFLLKIK